jgi:probable rRNA maturation factor
VKLSLSLSDTGRPAWLDADVEATLRGIAEALGESRAPVDLIVVDDGAIRVINRDFRGLDRPTDVISFSYRDESGSALWKEELAGEIYVSHQTVEREASAMGVEVRNVFLRTGVHGLLHVLGYDHESELDAARMESEEKRLLGRAMTAPEIDELF